MNGLVDMQALSVNCMTLSFSAVLSMKAFKQCLSFGITVAGLPSANLIKLEKVMGLELFSEHHLNSPSLPISVPPVQKRFLASFQYFPRGPL
jgi:hypothetical protein